MLDEILRLSHEEMAQEELAKARTILESDRVYDKETVQGHARKLGFFTAIAGDVGFEDRYLASLQKLTPADLRRVAAQYLRVSNLTVFAQVPEPKTDKQKARTEKIAPRSRNWPRRPRPGPMRALRGPPRGRRDVSSPTSSPRDSSFWSCATPRCHRGCARDLGGCLRYEDERSNGISHMLAALLSRGTRPQCGADHERGRGMAGNISGYSGRNSLGCRRNFFRAILSAASIWWRTACATPPSPRKSWTKRGESSSTTSGRRRTTWARCPFGFSIRACGRSIPIASILWGPQTPSRVSPAQAATAFPSLLRNQQPNPGVVGDVDPNRVMPRWARSLPTHPRPASRSPMWQANRRRRAEAGLQVPGQGAGACRAGLPGRDLLQSRSLLFGNTGARPVRAGGACSARFERSGPWLIG